MAAIQKGDKKGYNNANEELLELAQKEYPLSMVWNIKLFYKF